MLLINAVKTKQSFCTTDGMVEVEQNKEWTFLQVDLRGRDLDQLLDMSYQQPMVPAAWNLQGR